MAVTLSLLMPTRNRAEYLPAGVGFFLRTDREDVELIVSDASDNHEACRAALAPWLSDPRLVVIDNSVETTGKLSSMVENWSRALDAARGRWISIVGDDDVCDPQVLPFLDLFERAAPNIGAINWHHAHFDIDIAVPREAKVPLGTNLLLAAGRDSVTQQAGWPDPKKPLTALCSAYHGAVRREILERLKAARGAWFLFRTPDYDLGWSVAWLVEQFVVCERPFSITGVSPKSNSYAVRCGEKRQTYLINWLRESRELDGWGVTDDPFLFSLPMGVLGFRNAFCIAAGLNVPLNVDNFIGTLKHNLMNQEDETSFEQYRAALVRFLVTHFQQDFGVGAMERFIRPDVPMAGLVGERLVAPNTLFGGDIVRFAEMAFGIVRPVRYLFADA